MMTLHKNVFGTDLSPEQRKKLVHELRVDIPTHQKALQTLQSCLEGSSYAAEPKSLFIGGDSGMGKSTLIEAFAAKYPRVQCDVVDQIPVLVASIPSAATTKSTASSLLKALGDPKAFDGELARLTDRLLKFLKDCEVKMIVLDEFQHVIDRESSKVRAGTADWLKTVVNESKVPLALVGLPYSEVILEENIQLDRRFHRRIVLPRFTYNSTQGRASFRTLLKVLDDHMPFAMSAGLSEPKTSEWLFNCSKGLLGPAITLIREAAELAINDGAACVERRFLEEAYEDNRSNLLPADDVKGRRSLRMATKGRSLGEVLRR